MYKAKVENKIQLQVCMNDKNVSEIILSRDSFSESNLNKLVYDIKEKGKKASILMERISRYDEFNDQKLRVTSDEIFKIEKLDGIIIQNVDCFAYMFRHINNAANEKMYVELNYTMNCLNKETKNTFCNIYNSKRKNADKVPLRFTSSIELNKYEISDVLYDSIVGYGYIPTMVTANCLRKNTTNYSCKNRLNYDNIEEYIGNIKDRKNKDLYYKSYCKYCYNQIFNIDPLYVLDLIEDTSMEIRLDFTIENKEEVINILNKKVPKHFTRGHYKNTIY